ncbi:hypothetical protein A8B75_14385 [Sphingomonadales bacterium EhC05]|nr:hypothetical protein A8B75_14385 [Sphingomonadales bacterium EhC05]
MSACTDTGNSNPYAGLAVKNHLEMLANKKSGLDFVRSPKVVFNGNHIGFDVIVDEKGDVTHVSSNRDSANDPDFIRTDQFRSQAEAEARKWTFQPFLKNGKAIKVRIKISIDIYPPEILPVNKIPFPDVVSDEFQITLERSSCYGMCPDYTVTISGNGEVTYEGRYYTLVEGEHAYEISKTAVMDLLDDFRKSDFWSFREKYEAAVNHSPTYTLTFNAGKQQKKIENYSGLEMGMPTAIHDLENTIDKITDTERWVTGNSRTVTSLRKTGFNFQSKEAQNMLIKAIHGAPESVAIDLLNQGISLGGKLKNVSDRQDYPEDISFHAAALSGAIEMGWLELFKRLDDETILDSVSQNQKDKMLADAASANSPFLVSALLKRGASVKLEKSSPLIKTLNYAYYPRAKDTDKVAVVKMLIQAGVNIEAKDGIGWTALQHANDAEPEIVSILLAAGADVDAGSEDSSGGQVYSSSLLFLTENEDIALLAIKAGANTSLKTIRGKSFEQHAKEESWSRVLELIGK